MKIFTDTNGHKLEFETTTDNGKNKLLKNGKSIVHDLVHLGENRYSLILGNRSYRVAFTSNGEYMDISIDGEHFKVQIEDEQQKRLKTLIQSDESESGQMEIKAPIPGMIVKILIKQGDIVSKNDGLLVLEAMKMENIIRCPGNCEIEEICVNEQASVEKGQVLFRLQEQ